ncbi:MAG: 50S ribosomal protein L1 [Candidatus Odinarchaeota archaeon]|nr:50S ribosomal protein L1 [Candidatus Odinarchaeota archaeon]
MSIDIKKIVEAVKEAKEKAKERKFKESIDLSISFKNLDLKKPENRISAEVTLPHPINKPVKVCVIASGDLEVRAKNEGIDSVLSRTDLEKFLSDRKAAKKLAKQFDFFLAQVDLMPLVGRSLGPVLGPRGKMPKPIPPTADIKSLVEQYRRTVRIRMRNNPVIHVRVGTKDMEDEKIAENIKAVLEFLLEKLEKGMQNIKSIYVKTTMGPPVPIKIK